MAEIRITCPACSQTLQCDEQWAGHQIDCPICKAPFTVPQVQAATAAHAKPAAHNPLVPKPPAETKLSAGATQVARSSFGVAGPTSAYKKPVKKGGGMAIKLAKILGLLIVLVGAGFIVSKNLGLFNKEEAPSQEETLDKKAPGSGGSAGAQASAAAADPNAAPTPPPATNKPIVAPVYELDLRWAKIPDCQANGMISGGNFVAETVRLDRVDRSHVLSLRQGSGASPDREIRVYLKLGPGENITNRTWSVSEDVKAGAMTVVKGWKPRAGTAPFTKSFNGGYAMKVELGQMSEDNMISGKIYLALPDTEKTVVAGNFRALYGTAQTITQQPTETEQPQQSQGMDSRMRQRYNLGR